MKRVVIREQDGRFSLQNFGPDIAGWDGKSTFQLSIESKGRGVCLDFPHTTVFDIFTHFDLNDSAFLAGRFYLPDFVFVGMQGAECVVEASSGTLYDFFKERAATGQCLIRSPRPVAFYWRGFFESSVA